MYPRLRTSRVASIGTVIVIYFATAYVGLRLFDPVSGFASLVWPPAGIAVAATILFGKHLWPGIAAGAFLANVLTGAPLEVAFGIGIGNALEAVVAAYTFEQMRCKSELRRLRDVVVLVFWGAVVATSISATVGVSLLWISGIISLGTYDETWIAWWVGDALGILILAPVLFSIYGRGRTMNPFTAIRQKIGLLTQLSAVRTLEAVCLIATLFIGGYFIFWSDTMANVALPFLYLAILPPLWTGLRFGQKAAAWAVLALASLGIIATFSHHGPFIYGARAENLLLLQIFLGVMATKSLVYAALREEQRAAERRASNEHARLAEIVEARTAELQKRTIALAERNQEIESSRAMYETILEAIESAVVAIDTTGTITYLNQAAASIWGRPRTTLLGTPGSSPERQYFDPYGRPIPPQERPLSIAMQKGVTINTQCVFVRSEQERIPLFVSASPIRTNGRVIGAVAVFADITQDFEERQSKFKFVTTASHQFRTPISIIRWYAETLLGPECGTLTERQRGLVQEIHRTSERIAKLTGLMLDLTKIELGIVPAFATETVDLDAVMTAILQNFNKKIEAKSLSVATSSDGTSVSLNIHTQILDLIFGNIIDNAIRYTPEGGILRIHTAFDTERGMAICSVEDSGYGIPSDEHPKVFSELFRGSNVGETTPSAGFGLYVVKSLLSIVHGEIWFTSVQGVGSTFFIALPGART